MHAYQKSTSIHVNRKASARLIFPVLVFSLFLISPALLSHTPIAQSSDFTNTSLMASPVVAVPGKSITALLEDLEELAEETYVPDSNEAKVATRKMSKMLRSKHQEVRVRAAELLAKAPFPTKAIQELLQSLKKEQGNHKKVFKVYVKNILKLQKLWKFDRSKNAVAEYNRLLKTLRQFVEASVSLLGKLNDSREFSKAILSSLKEYRKDEVYVGIRRYFSRVKLYGPQDTISAMDILFSFQLRLGLEEIIAFYADYYNRSEMQVALDEWEELEESGDTEGRDEVIDWGKHIHDNMTKIAKKKKLSDYPTSFDKWSGPKWKTWFKANREFFEYGFEGESES